MSQMSPAKAERALKNRAYVRMLLRLRQPAFAAALASAEQDFFTARRGVARQTCSAAAAWPGLRRPAHQRDHGPALRNSRSVLTTAVCMTGCPHHERVVPGRR
jgi:hypothetical protein